MRLIVDSDGPVAPAIDRAYGVLCMNRLRHLPKVWIVTPTGSICDRSRPGAGRTQASRRARITTPRSGTRVQAPSSDTSVLMI